MKPAAYVAVRHAGEPITARPVSEAGRALHAIAVKHRETRYAP